MGFSALSSYFIIHLISSTETTLRFIKRAAPRSTRRPSTDAKSFAARLCHLDQQLSETCIVGATTLQSRVHMCAHRLLLRTHFSDPKVHKYIRRPSCSRTCSLSPPSVSRSRWPFRWRKSPPQSIRGSRIPRMPTGLNPVSRSRIVIDFSPQHPPLLQCWLKQATQCRGRNQWQPHRSAGEIPSPDPRAAHAASSPINPWEPHSQNAGWIKSRFPFTNHP